MAFLFILVLRCTGQGGYVPPKVPEKYCKDLNTAVLAADAGNTEKSIIEINDLIARYPTWTEPRHQLARIFYDNNMKDEAIETLKASLAIDTNSQLQQLYTLGRLYEEKGYYQNALNAYRTVISKGIHHQGLAQRAIASLSALEDKVSLFATDYTIELKPLPEGINTKDHEALGRWTIDSRELIFTRWSGGQEDLFIGRYGESGDLLTVEDISFNSEYSEGGHTISPDGKYIVFTSCDRHDGMGGCDLYLSVRKNNEWTKPINMGPGFNSAAWDSEPVFGIDGQSIYFASTRPGGFGGSDIWYAHEISPGKWSSPINIGSPINTPDNEESPFIYFDDRTIYFMRDGNAGLGGFDLYLARRGIDSKWQVVENMGAPINSGSDEGALAVHPDGTRALITRHTPDRKNDLFEFELPPQFRSSPVQALHVHVKDVETNLPVVAQLELFDVNGGDTIRVSQRGDEKGNITMTIDRGKNYGLITSAEGYVLHSSNLSPDTTSMREVEIRMVAMKNAIDRPVVLQNIFFETGSAKLLPSSDPELNSLVNALRKNPSMKIEIRGHTDDVGTNEYNQQLSEARAKSVYQFLINHGIDVARLSYKGFGETLPIADNATEKGKQQNRRTEFVIVSSEY